MKSEANNLKEMPVSHLPFAPATRVADLLFISGQASVDGRGAYLEGDFEFEMRTSMENLETILQVHGLNLDNVIQTRNYVGKEAYLPQFNQIYSEFFSKPYPSRTTIMECLGKRLKFEVEAIAVFGMRRAQL